MFNDVFIRYLYDLPATVNGATIEDENGDFNVYINANKSPEVQAKTIHHEMIHIRKEHFQEEMNISNCEIEANK